MEPIAPLLSGLVRPGPRRNGDHNGDRMARALHRLTARTVATAKPGKYADGGGLWLVVKPFGSKQWVFRYTRHNQERHMGLGAAHTVSLAQAREKALAARQALDAGRDPMAERDAARAPVERPTFEPFARAYVEEQRPGWTNPKHAAQWLATLETYAFPVLGPKALDQIETEDVLRVLRPIWITKTETANRVRQRIEAILDAATARKLRTGENPARWRGHLAKLLPRPSRVRQAEHFAALPYAQVPAFVKRLRAEDGVAARALEFLILTASRTGMITGNKDVPGMVWPEVDGGDWNVPRARMKNRKPFAVPLSNAAQRVLQAQPRQPKLGVFPGQRGPHLSTGAMDALLERMGMAHVTVHGFRSSFKDWATEQTAFANEVSEAALAHVVKDKTEAAYRRGALLEKRRELMQAWADFIG